MSIHGSLSHSFEESHSILLYFIFHLCLVKDTSFFSSSFAHCAHLQVYLWDKSLEVGIQCILFKRLYSIFLRK